MGCLLFPLELIFDAILDAYSYLMELIVPDKVLGKGARITLKIIVAVFTCILLGIMFIGLIAVISDDKDTRQLGKLMIFIPLGISAVQIVLGIIVRWITKKR